jgi:hypothetical protein
MLLDTYQKLEKRLARLDFTSLWQGFVKRSYALYTDESMCICGEPTLCCRDASTSMR